MLFTVTHGLSFRRTTSRSSPTWMISFPGWFKEDICKKLTRCACLNTYIVLGREVGNKIHVRSLDALTQRPTFLVPSLPSPTCLLCMPRPRTFTSQRHFSSLTSIVATSSSVDTMLVWHTSTYMYIPATLGGYGCFRHHVSLR
jgi:hypothetical protein